MSNAFDGCTSLTSADLSSLTTVSGQSALNWAFYGCTGLTSMSFPKLAAISTMQHAFAYCTSLTTLSFPKLQNLSNNAVFNNMLQGVTGCTVHFLSNLQSVIGSWTDVQNGFGGTNTTVLFDLPATT